MDLSAELSADLALLSGAIQDSGDGLAAGLDSLIEDLHRAVGSYLGLTVTIALDGHQISFTQRLRSGQATTSLRIPLEDVAGQGGSALVVYAATPGAFVDLAADMAWALKLDPANLDLDLDEHRVMPATSSSVIGLREHASINRAIGALVEHGHTPESAGTELRRSAEFDHGDVPAAAQRILDEIGLRELPEPG